VLFSDDGINIWESKTKLHSARRSNCKDWWNDHWRDRIVAALFILAKNCSQSDSLIIPISASKNIVIKPEPISFESPLSYDDEKIVNDPFEDEDILEEDLINEV
jgi:hypothetical protein